MVQAKPVIPILNTGDPFYPNLVCALPFNAPGDFGTIAHDLSANGLNATLTGGATYFNDPTLGAVVALDGSTGYITLSTLLNGIIEGNVAGSTTVSVWLRLVSGTPANPQTGLMDLQGITGASTASKWPAATPTFNGETAGEPYLSVLRGGSVGNTRVGPIAGISAATYTSWHLLTVSNQSGGNWLAFLNGSQIASSTGANPTSLIATVTALLGISHDSSGGPYYLNGWVGDFRVYNIAMTAPQALSLWNAPWLLYTVTAPIGQGRELALMADVIPSRKSHQTVRELVVVADVQPNKSAYSSRELVLMADVVPYKDPNQSNTPPNNPGSIPLTGFADEVNPRLKPDASPTPTLNADPINTGLVLAMPITEGTGGPQDQSGNGNNGTLAGNIAWQTDPNPLQNPGWPWGFRTRNGVAATTLRALGGAANTNYVNIPQTVSLKPASVITIAAWFRPNGTQTTGAIIAAMRNTVDNSISYGLTIDTTNGTGFRFAMTDNLDNVTEAVQATGFIGATTNAPFFIVGVYTGALQLLYVNGVLVASVGQSGNFVYDGTSPLRLLGDTAGGSSSPNGWLEDVKIWGGVALTQAQIQQLYAVEAQGFSFGAISDAGSGAFGPYCNGTVMDVLCLMADVTPNRKSHQTMRQLCLMADVMPGRSSQAAARQLVLMVDAKPAIQNAALLGIGSIFPNIGPTAGGQAVTIQGFNFVNVTSVLIGGVAATSVVVVNETTITCVTPAAVAGITSVQVNSQTYGTTIAQNFYQFVSGKGATFQGLYRGKQFVTTMMNQDPPNSFYTGMTAPGGVNTTLPFTLTDNPITPQATEVYVRHSSDSGYGRMRLGVDFNVDITNRNIIWLGATALFPIVGSDEMIVCYPGQH